MNSKVQKQQQQRKPSTSETIRRTRPTNKINARTNAQIPCQKTWLLRNKSTQTNNVIWDQGYLIPKQTLKIIVVRHASLTNRCHVAIPHANDNKTMPLVPHTCDKQRHGENNADNKWAKQITCSRINITKNAILCVKAIELCTCKSTRLHEC